MQKTKTKVGIYGYGNLGRGVEKALLNPHNKDMELVAIFSRRPAESISTISKDVKILSEKDLEAYKDKIDVMILCGGSATDLPIQGPKVAKLYNTVDSYDNHKEIPKYFNKMDMAALGGKHVSIISVGWDPGLFSINRTYAEAILPSGSTYTFWGKGVSQGHSDAIRRIPGVKYAIQYTCPKEEAITKVKNSEHPIFTASQMHSRECFVVIEDGIDKIFIEETIKTMPNYFSDYDTTVHFISEKEFKEKHSNMPHGGIVLRSGKTDNENSQMIEYSLKLDSNPDFTGSVLVSYARAAYRLSNIAAIGAKTVLDIPPSYLSQKINTN